MNAGEEAHQRSGWSTVAFPKDSHVDAADPLKAIIEMVAPDFASPALDKFVAILKRRDELMLTKKIGRAREPTQTIGSADMEIVVGTDGTGAILSKRRPVEDMFRSVTHSCGDRRDTLDRRRGHLRVRRIERTSTLRNVPLSGDKRRTCIVNNANS